VGITGASLPKSRSKYVVNIEGDKVEVDAPDFYSRTQTLAAAYRECRGAAEKGEIAQKLLDMCRPILRAWRIFDEEDRKEYEQESYLIVCMSLESFDPLKGAFVSWLKKYVKSKFQKIAIRGESGREHVSIPEGMQETPQPWHDEEAQEPDIDLSRLEKLIGTERWEMIRMRVLEGMSVKEIVSATGVNEKYIRRRLKRAYMAIRAGILLRSDSDSMQSTLEDGSAFLSTAQIAYCMDRSLSWVYQMCHEGGSYDNFPFKFHPDDFQMLGGTLRIRYRIKNGKRDFPRVLRRNGFKEVKPKGLRLYWDRKRAEKADR
jgi:RNA polymerase sigma factor (sigma-70 family)